MLAPQQPKILVRCCLETTRRMAHERRGAVSFLVSMETPYYKQYKRSIIGSREEEYQDKITEVQDNSFHRKRFYTQKLLHTDAFTQMHSYTQKLLHTNTFTHRSFYTQTLLHRCTFAHKHFYTQTLFTQKHFYTQTRLHTKTFYTKAFTHRHFYTQKLLHTDTFTHTLAQKYLIELLMWNAANVHKQSSKV